MHLPRLSARLLLATALIGLLAGAATAPVPSWPQATSDIAADPAVRFGVLPTGMRYAIMKNATPKGEVSIRLRFGTGSFEESDAQQGTAHFLEHMAFRGSAYLQTATCSDASASTACRGRPTPAVAGQTLYQFDLRAPTKQLNTGLKFAREIVDQLTLDPWRCRPSAVPCSPRNGCGMDRRRAPSDRTVLLKGQLMPERSPIGKVDVIRNAPVSEVADYPAFYRPERAALLWSGHRPRRHRAESRPTSLIGIPMAWAMATRFGQAATRGQGARVRETGAPQFVSVSWMSPYDARPDIKALRTEDRIEGIGLAILNQRFAQAAQSADPPFQGAGASRGNTQRSALIASLRVNYAGERWQRAFIEAVKIRRQVLEQGVTRQSRPAGDECLD